MAGILSSVDELIKAERQKRADAAMLQEQSPMPVQSQEVAGLINNSALMNPAPAMSPNVPGASIAPPPTAKPPGFFSRLGTQLKDPTTLTGLSAAFNQMSMFPNAQLQKRAGDMMAARTASQQSNKTVEYLRQNGREDLARLVEANPAMAAEVLKGLATSKAGGFMRKTVGGVQIDQDTGQMFTVEQNPNSGDITRTNIPGAFGLTEAEKNAALLEQTRAGWDISQGQEEGKELLNKFTMIDKQIQDFRRIDELVDEGAKTGFINKFLPSTNEATIELEQIAKRMGIDIINSATFGALSATELQLALSTGFDLNLTGEKLTRYIENKIAAQTKLRNALMPEVQMLLNGSGLAEYAKYKIENRKRHDFADSALSKLQKIVPDMSRKEWKTFNLLERERVLKENNLL